MQIHVTAVHQGLKEYKCEECNQEFARPASLRSHIDTVHEGKKPYKCDRCDKRFSHSGSIADHITAVHEGLKPFKCELCEDFASGTRQGLRAHVRNIHDGRITFKSQLHFRKLQN